MIRFRCFYLVWIYRYNYRWYTLFTADTFAPALINILTASLCPYRAAMCNGRMPNLKHGKWNLITLCQFYIKFVQISATGFLTFDKILSKFRKCKRICKIINNWTKRRETLVITFEPSSVHLFWQLFRFSSILFEANISIIIFSLRYYLVSGLDVAFRLYQHLYDLRVPPGCCPMNWRPTILNNHFPVQTYAYRACF